jgi:hypothetical protein
MYKNIVAYSLWGNNPIYWVGALKNIELVKKYFPTWICRFYIDKSCDQSLIDTIKGDNVEVILLEKNNITYKNISNRFDHSGLFWRFLPLLEKENNIILSRDCDSRISERECLAINEWLSSDKDFHIMRDHPYHGVPILTGMWGCRNGILSNINDFLLKWQNHKIRGIYHAEDQDFLGQLIYPYVKSKSFEHSEFNINFGNQIHNFPKERENYEFVGDVFDENNVRHPEYWTYIKKY